MLTKQQIDDGKKKHARRAKAHHEHDDCIRITYEWLDAQTKTLRPTKKYHPIKHIIEAWAGRYVSQDDVEVAAALHPDIRGRYPTYNISTRLVRPAGWRLDAIGEARAQLWYMNNYQDVYAKSEVT